MNGLSDFWGGVFVGAVALFVLEATTLVGWGWLCRHNERRTERWDSYLRGQSEPSGRADATAWDEREADEARVSWGPAA